MTPDELQTALEDSIEILMTGIADDAKEFAKSTAADATELVRQRLAGTLSQDEYDRCIIALADTPLLLASSKGFDTQGKIIQIIFFALKVAGGLSV